MSSFVVVANRLPVDEVTDDRPATESSGGRRWRPSPGGLVTALRPVLTERGGTWIGWTGSTDAVPDPFEVDGIRLHPVGLSEAELQDYYEGQSNATIWPLFHDAVEPPAFHRHWRESYKTVNQRYAEATAQEAAPGATVWVQDYQLLLVPAMLRELRPDLRIGFFLHIPFPPIELFMQLPGRAELLRGLLGADLIGFQRRLGAQNFVRLAKHLLGTPYSGNIIEYEGRKVRADAYPISIDVEEMEQFAASPAVQERAAQIRAGLGNPKTVILGVDRLDYTKGIELRLKVFRELLAENRLRVPDVVMVQVATPSRERVEHYHKLRVKVEREVGRINGDFGRVGVPAVHYLHQSYMRSELTALYCAADVMMVTPLRDGMNLVAKEYVAARAGRGGALVLSEFAGAASELRHAFLCNPHDLDAVKDALLEAVAVDSREAKRRMGIMLRHIRRHDVASWAAEFLDDLQSMAPPPKKPALKATEPRQVKKAAATPPRPTKAARKAATPPKRPAKVR